MADVEAAPPAAEGPGVAVEQANGDVGAAPSKAPTGTDAKPTNAAEDEVENDGASVADDSAGVGPDDLLVTNVSPYASVQTLTELFAHMGELDGDIKLFKPSGGGPTHSRTCFVAFKDKEDSKIALHLSTTVFFDRTIHVNRNNCESVPENLIRVSPDEPDGGAAKPGAPAASTGLLGNTPMQQAQAAAAAAQAALLGIKAPGMLPTPGMPAPGMPGHPAVSAAGALPGTASVTPGLLPNAPGVFPGLVTPGLVPGLPGAPAALFPTPPPNPIAGNIDPSRLEEIRRTIYVGNLTPQITEDHLLKFFAPCGQIKYVKIAGTDDMTSTKHAFVEFFDAQSAALGLSFNGQFLIDRAVKVNTSKNPVVKAVQATRDAQQALQKAKEAQALIAATLAGGKSSTGDKKKDRSRSRSRSPRRRSRSRSPRRRRSRSPRRRGEYRDKDRHRRRRRSRSRSPRRRSRSRSPSRSRRRDRKKRRSSKKDRDEDSPKDSPKEE
eukprot:m.488398 g.488398  ORF g.488398 m.488398 type:complete len:494 (+) comp25752_c0_seq1:161-1642(+)